MRKNFVAGNWKMNKTVSEGKELITDIIAKLPNSNEVDVVVCPPFTHLEMAVKATRKTTLSVGAQDVSVHENGAYTGEISAEMIKSTNAEYVIVGHSERRLYHNENNHLLNRKLRLALSHGLDVIFCVGESLTEREVNLTKEVVLNQVELGLRKVAGEALPRVTVAYEPIWAIGTGKTATPEQAQEVHAVIRQWMSDFYGKDMSETVRIVYGGSVKPDNAEELMKQPDIDGALVGGACLKADSFAAIIDACLN
jgi:triosephosphate isomerase